MNQLSAIVSHIPVWVPIVFFVLLGYGLSMTRDRTVPLRRTVSLPVALLALSFYGAFTTFHGQMPAIIAWVAGVAGVIGVTPGRIDTSRVRFDSLTRRFFVPGSRVPLMLMMALFALKFGVGMQTAMHPDLSRDAMTATWISALYGVFAGGFLARSMALWSVSRQGAAPTPVHGA